MRYLSFLDLLWVIILPLFFILHASVKSRGKGRDLPGIGYYKKALIFRLFMVLVFLGIYMFYYGGGDTIEYFTGAKAMRNLLFYNQNSFARVMVEEVNAATPYKYFNMETGTPPYHLFRRSENFTVVRFATLPSILTGGSIIGISLIFAFFSFIGAWRLYQVFLFYFPDKEKILAFSILFFPSTAFWGSGIMKDTISFTGLCFFIHALFTHFVLRRGNLLANWTVVMISAMAVWTTKSYILIAAAPGILLWLNFELVRRIKSRFIRGVLLPFLITGSAIGGFQLYMSSSDSLEEYSSERIFETAATIQQDLAREEAYGSNKFDIGAFDPTLQGVLKKFPVAVFAGLYRPMLWEAGNIVMVFSGLENLFLLSLTILLILKNNPIGFFIKIGKRPLYLFCLTFSILFAFSVGLTSANFGALVRYKIQIQPFLVSLLFLLWYDKGLKEEPNPLPGSNSKKITDKKKT
jgi:hypothetical protein